MSFWENPQDNFNMNFTNEDLSRNDSKCTNNFITKFKSQKFNVHFEKLEIHLPLCDTIEKLNESSINLLKNIYELLESVDFESDSRFFIFNQVNCDTLDLYFQALFNWIENHYSLCSSSETSFNSTKRAINLISEFNQILSGILSVCDRLKLSKLELDYIEQNESVEKILDFYKNFNQHFEKLLLDYVGEIHVIIFEMVLEFEIDYYNKETQNFDECAIKCQNVLGDNILNINTLAKNLDEIKKPIDHNNSISLRVEGANSNNETMNFDENIRSNTDTNDGNKKIELLDIQRNEAKEPKNETNKDQYNLSYDYYDDNVEEPFIDPFDSFSDNFIDNEEEYFDNLEELFNTISASEASSIRSHRFNNLEHKVTNLSEATPSILTNSSSIGSEGLSANAYSSFYLYSIVSIMVISFACIIGGFIAYYRSKNKRTKKVNRENVENILL